MATAIIGISISANRQTEQNHYQTQKLPQQPEAPAESETLGEDDPAAFKLFDFYLPIDFFQPRSGLFNEYPALQSELQQLLHGHCGAALVQRHDDAMHIAIFRYL